VDGSSPELAGEYRRLVWQIYPRSCDTCTGCELLFGQASLTSGFLNCAMPLHENKSSGVPGRLQGSSGEQKEKGKIS
jgi:hypothetical protein